MENIRNFVIIAHIDHGKSTLADRFLELTGTIEKRKMREQFLDQHPLERERGITIKMAPVRMIYHAESLNLNPESLNNLKYQNSKEDLEIRNSRLEIADSKQMFVLNLIDTPGHVDFSYEVSRALACVEGAILLVDATQGIQAQTLANLDLAQKEGLTIIPAVNKIDLQSAEVEKTREELSSILEVSKEEIFRISAKLGAGVEELLRALIEKVPPPSLAEASYDGQSPPKNREGELQKEQPLRALVFDSLYDPYLGVIAYVRVFDGALKKGEKLFFVAARAECKAEEVGYFSPERSPCGELGTGEIGYAATGIKEPEKVRVGDTIIRYIDMSKYQNVEMPPGYKEPIPVVFASISPENQDEYEALRDSLKKLKLNDASFTFEPEESGALGRGFRAGFLGMLHMEIAAERLKREYGLNLIFSSPSVAFKVKTKEGEQVVYAASKMPETHFMETVEEPWVKADIITPPKFLGAVSNLISGIGGRILETSVLGGEKLRILAEAPLREIIVNFYDRLKSVSHGFASMAYEVAGYKPGDLARLNILVAGERISAFSDIVPRAYVLRLGRERIGKLKELMARELFAVPLQAEVDGRIIARETIPALRKDVTGYLYGGDRTRKMKLWKKQQKGKKKLKELGRVEIPPEVFLKMMKPR